MNTGQRDGWPPSQAAASAPGQQQTEQGQGQVPRPLNSFGCVLLHLFPLAGSAMMNETAFELFHTPLWFVYTDDDSDNRPNNATHQLPSQTSPAQGSGPVLPPPSSTKLPRTRPVTVANLKLDAPFYSSNAAAQHNQNLPALSGLGAQPPQASPHLSAQRPPSSESGPAPQGAQTAPQGPSYSLPGISQTLQQPHGPAPNQTNSDRERELRERENMEREIMGYATQQEERIKMEAEQRERELRDRQQHEQVPHENHSAPIQIHQPVAVAPSTRTIHGPNGLLGQSGPLSGPSIPGPGPSNSMFGVAAVQPVQQGETTPRMQHAVQPPPQPNTTMLMPFVHGNVSGTIALNQGQQPILNVSKTSANLHDTKY
jgi:paired amphipathic helix protein Sin3a